jgi:superfamily I DNA and RNA helicase
MQGSDENKIVSVEQGRKLIEITSLSGLNDEELQELLESIKVFCEINFEMYLDFLRKHNMEEIDEDFATDSVILLDEDNQENLVNAA